MTDRRHDLRYIDMELNTWRCDVRILFFQKNNEVITIASTDTKRIALLVDEGWQKLVEEVAAADSEKALARLTEIRKEEEMTEHAFITGSVLSGLFRAMLK